MPRPFLKWAGKKTQLLSAFRSLYPARDAHTPGGAGPIRCYWEPFLGSGAVFFDVLELLKPKRVVLSDQNEQLVDAWQIVRDDVANLIELLTAHGALHDETHYYEVRAQDTSRLSQLERAARLIYLNRTCFNGLYRVNSRGLFNVPMGRYATPPNFDAENLREVSACLQDVDIRLGSYSKVVRATAQDFVYFDPPYHPVSETSYFTSYTAGVFGAKEQEELAKFYRKLSERGTRVMLSNSDVPLIRNLYPAKDFRVAKVQARRLINSKSDGRGLVSELVVLSYL